MCHLSMKLSDTFDPYPLYILTKLGKTHSDEKRSHGLTLRAKVKVIAKINAQGNKKHASQKKFSRGSLSNWCDTDADICKTICRPPP